MSSRGLKRIVLSFERERERERDNIWKYTDKGGGRRKSRREM